MTSSAAVTNYPPNLGHDRRGNRSSATWTTSSGDMGLFSDTDEIDERSQFVQEYNRLAKKVGRRGFFLVLRQLTVCLSTKCVCWFLRTMKRLV